MLVPSHRLAPLRLDGPRRSAAPRRRSRSPEARPASEWFDDRRPERELIATTDVPEHRRLAEDALWSLTQPTPGARLPALAQAMRAWLVADRPRGAVRAALQATGVTRALLPILAGADTLRPDSPTDADGWTLAFTYSLEHEAADGLAILRRLEHTWRSARPPSVRAAPTAACRPPSIFSPPRPCPAGQPAWLLAAWCRADDGGAGGLRRCRRGDRTRLAPPLRPARHRGHPRRNRRTAPLRTAAGPSTKDRGAGAAGYDRIAAAAPAVPARLDRLEVDYTTLAALLADTNRVVGRVQAMLKKR
ncbi:hypothetical protein ABNQ39_36625 (plasmid) [Azospirillum sp. A26]|uniref:hypothetical protein n=1 Tax=Azospirillum sp. A26 TaxID=3160607 RepID=UPI00366DB1DE